MAAFVHRGFGRTGWTVGAPETLGANAGLRDLAVLTIDVGGVPGQTAFVKLDGVVTTSITSLVGCPCGIQYHLVRDGATAFADRYLTNSTLGPGGGPGYETGAVTAVAVVPTGTTQTFRLQARRDGSPPITGTLDAYADLTAITAPFGSTGGNTLAAAQTSARTAALSRRTFTDKGRPAGLPLSALRAGPGSEPRPRSGRLQGCSRGRDPRERIPPLRKKHGRTWD